MKNRNASQYSNYITISDVFHPESLYATEQAPPSGNAEVPVVMIDEPPHPAAGANKWNVVWAEATLLKEDPTEAGEIKNGSNATTQVTAPAASAPTMTVLDAPYYHSGLIESIIGLPLTASAVAATALTEVVALFVYAVAVVFHIIALNCKTANCGVFTCIPLLLYLIFGIHTKVLMLCDYVILLCSVIISETIAVTCWILNSVFSGFRTGMLWHQYIRRVCHVTRWAFRDFHRDWEPPRVFPWGRPPETSSPATSGLAQPSAPPAAPTSMEQPLVTPTAPVDPEIAVDPYDVTKPNSSNDVDIKV